MKTYYIFIVNIVVVICIIAMTTTTRDISGISGGWEQISNLNDPEGQEIARWAVAEHARQANDGPQFKMAW